MVPGLSRGLVQGPITLVGWGPTSYPMAYRDQARACGAGLGGGSGLRLQHSVALEEAL